MPDKLKKARAIVFYVEPGANNQGVAKYRNVDAREGKRDVFERRMKEKFPNIHHINYYNSDGIYHKQTRP